MAHELVCPTCCPITGDLHAGVPPLYVDTSHVTFPKPSSRLQSDTFSIAHISTHVQSATSRNDRIFRDLKLPESLRTLKLCSSLEEEPEETRVRDPEENRQEEQGPEPEPEPDPDGSGSTCTSSPRRRVHLLTRRCSSSAITRSRACPDRIRLRVRELA